MDLIAAVMQGLPLEDIERLLAANPGAAVAADVYGRVPIHAAARWARTDVVRALLAAAPTTARAAGGRQFWTPLNFAVMWQHTETALVLLQAAPAAALMLDISGRTPLHLAAARGNAPLVQALLAAAPGAASLQDNEGRTPLQWALVRGRIEVARPLLLGPVPELLEALAGADARACPLYADLVASRSLAEEWRRVPSPCAPLAAACPQCWSAQVQRRGCWCSTRHRPSSGACALLRCAWCGRSGRRGLPCQRS